MVLETMCISEKSRIDCQLSHKDTPGIDTKGDIPLLTSLIASVGKAPNLSEAIASTLKEVCQYQKWLYGEAWQLDSVTNSLHRQLSWYEPSPSKMKPDLAPSPARSLSANLKRFDQLSKKYTFPLGDNLPGRLWMSQTAEQYDARAKVPTSAFVRQEQAQQCGLMPTLAVPLVANGCTIAVLVFFNDEAIAQTPQAMEQVIEQIRAIAVPINLLIQRRHSETALAEERERTKVTLKSIGDAVITTDALGYIRYLNPVAETLTGWSQSEAAGNPMAKVFNTVHESTREPTTHLTESVLKNLQSIHRAKYNVLVTRRGSELSIESSVSPLLADNDRLIGLVTVFSDVSKNRLLTRQLSWQANHDVLTGLVNRKQFEQHVSDAVDSAVAHGKTHTLCYFDLDNFKIINDTCGHNAGDSVLKQVSALLTNHIRATDTLARLDGDEFGLLLEYCHLDHAQRTVHKLREKLEALKFVCEGRTFSIGVSIGVTAITSTTVSMATALSDADAACHLAKRKGRNRTHINRQDDLELAQQRGEVQWAAYITDALETEKFELYQQPILALSSPAALGEHYEVLLRLRDQTGQLVSPGAFMPAAERYNLMPMVDRWVVSTLFSTQASYYQQVWQQLCNAAASPTDPSLQTGSHLYSINLSGASINDEGFIHFLKEQFAKYSIPPALICFEITETATIENLIKAAQFITELRELGCQFALDDFGSGMSSFAYLKTLPVDYLKIDGHFIQNIAEDKIDTAMVTAIHQIAQVMNIQTVAEFVEDEATLETVKALGIGYAQGYGIARPMPL